MIVPKRLASGLALLFAAAVWLASAADAQPSPSSFTTGHRYDLLGRETGTIDPDPDGAGPLHYHAVRRTYDDAGRLVRIENGELAQWQSDTVDPTLWPSFSIFEQVDIAYDTLGQKVQETKSLGGTALEVTQYSYDPVGRLLCTATRMNPATFGSLPDACVAAAQGSYGPDRITKNVYDPSGELVQIRKAVGTALEQAHVTYGLTPNGRQQFVIDADGNRAQITYDGLDRKSGWYFPSPVTPAAFDSSSPATALATAGAVSTTDYEAYGYDGNDNRTSLKKRDGATIGFQYDALNRVTLKTVPQSASGAAGYSVVYGYDLRGQQTSARFGSDSGPGITNAYDGFGRLSSTTTTMDGASRAVSSQYDGDGNRTQVSTTTGTLLTFGYDGMDRMQSIQHQGVTTVVQLTYDAAGRRQSLGLGLGATTSSASYGYDGAGRLTGLSHDLAGSTADQSLTFGYNPAHQIITRTSSNDAYASNTATNVGRSYSVNGLNQYTGVAGNAYSYDANGNLTADGIFTYVYDAENRLVSRSGGITLAYDPNGRLWQISGPSGTTRFLYDGNQVIEEFDGNGNPIRSYAHGPATDEPLVWWEQATGWQPRFLHADHQGSITAIADGSGNMLAIDAYDAWGVPNSTTVTTTGRFGYTGQAWLPELGMWYYKARIYSPMLGRFLQTDPVGYKDQINLYAYVGNDPIDLRDPDGLFRCSGYIECGFEAVVDVAGRSGRAIKAGLFGTAAVALGYITYNTDESVRIPVYRVFGGKASQWGKSWTIEDPRRMPNWRDRLAVYPAWNSGEYLVRGYITINDLKFGGITPGRGPNSTAGPQPRDEALGGGPYKGRGNEIIIPNARKQVRAQYVEPFCSSKKIEKPGC